MARERLSFIDIAKGIGIILVILGHTEISGFPRIWLYSFHVPLFFFASGLVLRYNENQAGTFLKKRILSILCPYILFSVISILKNLILSLVQSGEISVVKNDLIGTFLQMRNTDYSGSFWFLPVMLEASILFLVVELCVHKTGKQYIRCIGCIVYFVLGYLWIQFIGSPLPWNFDAGLIAGSFILGGKIMRNYFTTSATEYSKGKQACCFIIALLINVISAIINSNIVGDCVDLYWFRMGNPFLYLIAAYSGIYAVMMLSIFIHNNGILEFFGKNTLLFYCLHHEFVMPVVKRVLSSMQGMVIEPYVTTIVVCILLIPISIIINRYIPILAGKYRKKQ